MAIFESPRPRSAEDAFIKNNKPKRTANDGAIETSLQEKSPVVSFTAEGLKAAFPVIVDTASGGNRIVRHERPYRPGAKLDSTGSKERVWQLTAAFGTSADFFDEEEVLEANEGAPLYPDVMMRIVYLGTIQATGDLIVPIDGKVRARLESWSRTQPQDSTDYAEMILTFVEDNEDDVNARNFSKPSARGSASKVAANAQFVGEAEGMWNADSLELHELCAELEGLLKAPGEMGDAIVAKMRKIRRAMKSLVNTANETRSSFFSPPIKILREMGRVGDVIGIAELEQSTSAPRKKRVWYTVTEPISIFALAAKLRQPADVLQEINAGRIDDPLLLEPGEYRVFQSWP